MSNEIKTLSDIENKLLIEGSEVSVNYRDEDILIFDNFRPLSSTDNVYVNMYVVACCRQGRVEATTSIGKISVGRNEVFICSPDTMVENLMVSPDLDCAIVCITTNGLRSILGNYMQMWTKTVVVNKLNIMKLEETDMQVFNHFYSLLEMSLNGDFKAWYPFRRDIVQQTLKFGLLGLCNNLSLTASNNDLPDKANSDNGFARFLELLQNTQVKYRPVESYAGQLCISSKYLTVLCRRYSNKTAQEWIREYTLNDISYYLRNTNLTLKEIADRLGFPNTSFFGKYVKAHFGLTPRQYREQSAS